MAKKRFSFRDRISNTLSTIKSPTMNVGFNIIDKWVSSGNGAVNRRMSGQWDKAFLYGRNYIIAGESGSAKSLLLATTCSHAQKDGALIVWIDVEKATDDNAGKAWLKRAGVDVDENFIFATAATLSDIKTLISSICKDYRKELDSGEELQPLVFVVDSWSAAITESQYEQALKGEVKGDQGQKAKQLGDLILAATHLVGGLPIMVLGVLHIMDNQDMYASRKHKLTGGNKIVYMASGALLLTKKEMKDEDVEDKEVIEHYKSLSEGMTAELRKKKKFVGITSTMEILKSRVSKPFEKVDIQIPFLTGITYHSGLFDVMMQEGLIKQSSPGWYEYMKDGEPVKFRKAAFVEEGHADALIALSEVDISVGPVVDTDTDMNEAVMDEETEVTEE